MLHFPLLNEFEEKGKKLNYKYFHNMLKDMHIQFGKRFQDFRCEKPTLNCLTNPLDSDISLLNFEPFPYINRAKFELQFEDLKPKDMWKSKLTELVKELVSLERV